MVDFCTGDREHIAFLYRDAFFDKCLDELRAKGGEALIAAKKVDEFIDILLKPDRKGNRAKFRFTRNKEARIRNCKKVDLGCGYRLVCIKKDGYLALLYVGTHDDCFRWIARNKGLAYDFNAGDTGVQAVRQAVFAREESAKDMHGEDGIVNQYEASLMSRIDDDVLRSVFHGLCTVSPGKDAADKRK
jgi:hypothetical protein